jgi:tRNA(fMet)-specific endonuclease VapC
MRKLRPGEAALSVITYGELIYGAAKSAQRVAALERLRELVQLLPALSLPESAPKRTDRFGRNWKRKAR